MLQQYIPTSAIDYCTSLQAKYPFKLMIKQRRTTKFGDYRYHYQRNEHVITINNDLNPYSFLITYLHEVAHLTTILKYGRKVKPHGKEWKNEFKLLMLPVLTTAIFPDDVLRRVAAYIKNPKASSCSDHQLTMVLNTHDLHENRVFLSEVPAGEQFHFGNRRFLKLELRRTRYVCKQVNTDKKYLISKSALVEMNK